MNDKQATETGRINLAVRTLALLGLLVNMIGFAQTPPVPERPVSERQVVPIWPGTAPGSENATQQESTLRPPFRPEVRIVRNVTSPTLTVYLPKDGNPSRTAVIVAPGGGFRVLAIDEEGYSVADWFSQRGIAAFVLKYRLAPTPGSDDEFMPAGPPGQAPGQAPVRPPGQASDRAPGPGIDPSRFPLPEEAQRHAIADGLQAIKVVRANASEWGISPDRVVIVGFSAGGALASGTMIAENPADRPNYAALIYGAPLGELPDIPADTPPAFMAVAEDDTLAVGKVLRFFNALREAGAQPELHVFRNGQHGFVSHQRDSTSDYWIDEMYWWMESWGLTRP